MSNCGWKKYIDDASLRRIADLELIDVIADIALLPDKAIADTLPEILKFGSQGMRGFGLMIHTAAGDRVATAELKKEFGAGDEVIANAIRLVSESNIDLPSNPRDRREYLMAIGYLPRTYPKGIANWVAMTHAANKYKEIASDTKAAQHDARGLSDIPKPLLACMIHAALCIAVMRQVLLLCWSSCCLHETAQTMPAFQRLVSVLRSSNRMLRESLSTVGQHLIEISPVLELPDGATANSTHDAIEKMSAKMADFMSLTFIDVQSSLIAASGCVVSLSRSAPELPDFRKLWERLKKIVGEEDLQRKIPNLKKEIVDASPLVRQALIGRQHATHPEHGNGSANDPPRDHESKLAADPHGKQLPRISSDLKRQLRIFFKMRKADPQVTFKKISAQCNRTRGRGKSTTPESLKQAVHRLSPVLDHLKSELLP